jgi:dTDP-4-dehydrorhamnose 3,5-epimerase
VPFTFEAQPLSGVVLVRPRIFPDERGAFLETYKASELLRNGLPERFVQDNLSVSRKGVLRGLHFQRPPKAQGKLVQAMSGSIWDVAVDLRRDSATYLKWLGITLNASEHTMIYIPPGFAHGFLALTEGAAVFYKCTEEYDPAFDTGVRWNDPRIGIQWPVNEPVLSAKDSALPLIAEIESGF